MLKNIVGPLGEEILQSFEQTLSIQLGPYYGNDVWIVPQVPDSQAALVKQVERDSVPIDWIVVPNGTAKLFILERHISKKSWVTSQPNEPIWKNEFVEKGYKPAVITFYSFKGGAGRTTALAATAINLSRFGFRVGIIDFDLEAPGIGSLFFPPNTIEFGAIDYILEKPIHERNWSIRQQLQVVSEQLILGDNGQPIHLIPAGKIDKLYMEKLARIDLQAITSGETNDVIHDLLNEMAGRELKLDFILVDARAGFHDIGGIALTKIAHGAVLFGVHSEQTWAGLGHAIRRVANHNGERPLPVVMVHALAPSVGMSSQVDEIMAFRERSYDTFLQEYYSEDEVASVNINNEDEPFYPVVLPYDELLRGEIFLYSEEHTRSKLLATIAYFIRENGPYRKLAEKVLQMFGREVNIYE